MAFDLQSLLGNLNMATGATTGSLAPPVSAVPPVVPQPGAIPLTSSLPGEGDGGPAPVVGGNVPYNFHGMFGLHGVARDIIGALGDAFLRQGGGQAVYAPRQQQEREAQAMRGFVDDPVRAMNRLSQYNPAAARDMFEHYQDDKRLDATQADLAATRRQVTQDRARAAFSSYGGAANRATWPAMRQRLQAMASAGQIDVPPDLLPETWSDDIPERLIRLGTAPGTQLTADNMSDYRDLRIRQIDAALDERRGFHQGELGIQGGRNAETGRHNSVTEGQGAQGLDIRNRAEGRQEQDSAWNHANPPRSRRMGVGAVVAPGPSAPAAPAAPRMVAMRNRVTGQVRLFPAGQVPR